MCSLDSPLPHFVCPSRDSKDTCAFPKYVKMSRKPHESSRNLTCCGKWLRIMVVGEWLMAHGFIYVRKLLY